MPLTAADAATVGYEPKELIVNLVAKALLSEHDEDKAQGYVAFVRDALEGWFTNDEPSKSEIVPVFETDQLNYLYDEMTNRDGLIHRFAEDIKELVLQSCDNLLNDANAIKVLRTDLIEGAVPLSGGKKQKVMKQIEEEYSQRMQQLDDVRKVLVNNMEIMEKFQKSQELMDKQRQMRKIDRYDVEKWTKAWAEQRKKAGGPTFGPNGEQRKGKGGEEKSKEKWEFEAKKWSQECAMFAVFNEFLLSQLAESHSAFCLMEVCVARQDNELKDMEKRMKITENVNNAKHRLEMDALKDEHVKTMETMLKRLQLVKGFVYDEANFETDKLLEEEQQDAIQKEVNRVFMESGPLNTKSGFSATQAEAFKNFDKRMEKENQELAKGDKEIGEKVKKIKAMALSHLNDKTDSYKMLFEKHQKKITITSHSGEMIKNEMLKIFERRLEECEKKDEKRIQSLRATAKVKNPAIPSKSSKKRAARKARQQRKAEQSSEVDKTEENESESENESLSALIPNNDPLLDEMMARCKQRLGYDEAYRAEPLDSEECESLLSEEDSNDPPYAVLAKRQVKIAKLEKKLKEMSGKLEESEQAYLAKDRELSMAQTGFLRRGLGLSRGHMEKNGCGMRNGVNQYM